MLAPPRRQNLIPPPGHANRPAKIPPTGRPCWRRPAGKTLSHRRATPTGRPKSRLPAVHVGASPPAKPYSTVGPRQQSGPNLARQPSMLAPPRRQNLITPSGHANSPAQIPPAGRPWWRLAAGKTLSHRRATPTVRPESRPAAVHVGAPPPAKPYPTVGPRQQSGPNPACRPSMLALSRRQSLIPPPAKPYPTAGPRQQAGPNLARQPSMLAPPRRQNLIPPPGHANRPAQIPPGSRPCWRRPAGKTLSHRRATPTGRPKSRPAAAHVGASPPAKPYPTAGPRQQVGPNPACRPPMLPPPLAGGRRL